MQPIEPHMRPCSVSLFLSFCPFPSFHPSNHRTAHVLIYQVTFSIIWSANRKGNTDKTIFLHLVLLSLIFFPFPSFLCFLILLVIFSQAKCHKYVKFLLKSPALAHRAHPSLGLLLPVWRLIQGKSNSLSLTKTRHFCRYPSSRRLKSLAKEQQAPQQYRSDTEHRSPFLALYGKTSLSPVQDLTSKRKLNNSRACDATKAIA